MLLEGCSSVGRVRSASGALHGRSPDEVYLTERGGVDRDFKEIDE